MLPDRVSLWSDGLPTTGLMLPASVYSHGRHRLRLRLRLQLGLRFRVRVGFTSSLWLWLALRSWVGTSLDRHD